VLSQVPALWAGFVTAWNQRIPSPDPMTALFLWQNIFGVWPVDGKVTDELRARLHAYTEKAIREAAAHTTWNDPDADFEQKVHEWIDSTIDGPVATELTTFAARIDEHARSDGLGQKLIQLTAPGIPDVYQGTELWDDSLVDPDNRRPVDYRVRREALSALQHPKVRVVTAALRLRRAKPEVFTDGGYIPLLAEGPAAGHLAAFVRGNDVVTAVTRHSARLAETGWGDTLLTLPDGTWTDRIGAGRFSGAVSPGELFAELPVALLERADD
jgi:(1->4)-alpha-D-glucan 1-alpha-D-glucosylmutase